MDGSIADNIPELDVEADILLLIGRDTPPLHKVHESRNGPRDAPWAQRLDLGWVVIGNACLNGAHRPNRISSFKTQLLDNGRPTYMEPCPALLYLEHGAASDDIPLATHRKRGHFIDGRFEDGLRSNVFMRTKDDNKPGTSIEDRRFLKIMDEGMTKDDKSGSWTVPLPLRDETVHLPDNRENALKRLKSTCRMLNKKPTMKEHYFNFMQKLINSGHAEIAPGTEPEKPAMQWYLPHFGVYHPQKPGKIRVVFDSAAETEKVSLNKLLLSGPDLNNGLLGVLIRFHQDPVAFMADIEQMFHPFLVKEKHRDLLRFFWFKDNDLTKPLTEYRMRVHVFGNTSSPAVATYGLRKTAEVGESEFGSDAKDLVDKNFYEDDALKSVATPSEAINLLRRTQAMLATANLRLHKIASSHSEVTQAFPEKDQATDIRNLDLSKDNIPVQRSLGVFWDLKTDAFTLKVSSEKKPFSRRGVLSTINSLYDPLGLAAPVTIKGKFLLRSMSANLSDARPGDWDTPLPEEQRPAWEQWRQSLLALDQVRVPRAYSMQPTVWSSTPSAMLRTKLSEQLLT